MIKEIPTQLNVLRASASADAYRKSKILEQLADLQKVFQSLNNVLNRIALKGRNTELMRQQLAIKEKLDLLTAGHEALEMYTGLDEQRRRTVISILETLVGELSPSSMNSTVLKKYADEVRKEYATSRETDYAVEGMRALADAYAIAPPMQAVIISEPTMAGAADELENTK